MWGQIFIFFLNFNSIFDTLNCVSAGGLHAVTDNAFTVFVYRTERGWSLVRLEKLQEKMCSWKVFLQATSLNKLS